MKNYIIWLIGGGCIEGVAEDKELNDLKEAWVHYKCNGGNSIGEYHDADGPTVVDFKDVQAIAINNQIEIKNIGYKA